MAEHLPELIDPRALAEKCRQFKGTVPLSRMSRLRDVLMTSEGEADFELKFEKAGRILTVTGLVKADLVLQCQCCLDPLPCSVSSPVSLGVVGSIEEAGLLPDTYEPLLLEGEGTIALADVIQDELLLAIPSVPQHRQCIFGVSEPKAPDPSKRSNPFAVLADLKN